MNNSENAIDFIEPTPARDALRAKLDSLLINIRRGIVPEKQELSVLWKVFQNYKNEEKELRVKRKVTHEQSQRTKEITEFPNNTPVLFNNVLPEDIEELSDISCLNDINNVRFLKQMVLQKLIPDYQISSYDEIIKQLIQKGCISYAIIELKGVQQKYYMLTSKGWHMLSLKKI